MPTGADLVIDNLHTHGVRTIFGMPGSHTTALYDAIVRHGQIQTILVRNEQAAAYAADGYARASGRLGVVCTTAGPGATNALTGIAETWGESVPLLLIAGQVNHDRLHEECGNYHEIDLEAIFRPCTKYVATVMEHGEIPRIVAEAFRAMTRGRPRPAALLLPQDLMALAVQKVPAPPGEETLVPGRIGAAAIKQAAELLAQAKRPLLLAGGGVVWARAGDKLRQLAERLDCPVATTLNGKGILDERDPRALGHVRSARGKVALPEADVVVALGCRFTEVMTGFRALRVPGQIIQVDVDPAQIGVNYPVAVRVVGDVAEALRRIHGALPPTCASDWSAAWPRIRAARTAQPEWLIETLRASLPDDAIVVTDASEMAYRMHMEYPAYAPRTFFYPSNYIALGWGYPAAMGCAVACPERAVVSVSGDGGFLMTCQELATAARYHLRVIAVVHNDQAYGAIKNQQRVQHEGRYLDTDLNNPDFVKLADAYGVPGCRARNAAEFARALQEALARGGPALIEVPDKWRSLRV